MHGYRFHLSTALQPSATCSYYWKIFSCQCGSYCVLSLTINTNGIGHLQSTSSSFILHAIHISTPDAHLPQHIITLCNTIHFSPFCRYAVAFMRYFQALSKLILKGPPEETLLNEMSSMSHIELALLGINFLQSDINIEFLTYCTINQLL